MYLAFLRRVVFITDGSLLQRLDNIQVLFTVHHNNTSNAAVGSTEFFLVWVPVLEKDGAGY